MPEFSHLVRQRLALAKSAESHPDADTLTAYAEQLLPSLERHRILQHLAACAECRDVVSLSLETMPAEAEIRQVATPARPARRSWTPWFGLASALTAAAIAAILIVERPQMRHPAPALNDEAKLAAPAAPPAESANLTSAEPAASPKAETVTRSAVPAPVLRARQPEIRDHVASFVVAESAAPAPPVPAPPVVVASTNTAVRDITASVTGGSRRDYINDNLFRSAESAGQTQSIPSVADIPGSRSASQFQTAFGNIQLPGISENKPIGSWTPSPGRGMNFINALKTAPKRLIITPSIAAGALVTKAMGGDGQFNPTKENLQSEEIAAASSRAKDGAELSQSSALTKRALSASALATLDTHPETAWAVGNGKLLRTNETGAWVSGYPGADNIEFSTVTFHGSDVWAGGNRAALFHSRDGGSTWERVRLGDNASGTISTIFASGLSVQVTTSENQSWASQDGGKTWAQN